MINVQKTRRKIEDVLRKSDQGTVIRVAKLLGVEIVKSFLREKIPESEIFLADLWEKSEGEKCGYSLITPNDAQGRKILKLLPIRFETYSIRYNIPRYNEENTLWRDLLTFDAAEEFKKELKENRAYGNMKFSIEKISRNVVQMRMCLRAIKQKHRLHLKPDEKEVFKELEQILLK